jgi:anthranilate phosphoribosyltransferase
MESENLMQQMLNGELAPASMGQILVNLADRGETVEEITGMAKAMRSFVVPVKGHEDAIDNCGTGGSGLPRINTSTISAFILGAEGVKVAKHGNRSAGGRCGSFDVLEAVGVNIELNAEQVEKTLEEMNIGFMYARLFHPAMKAVAPVRKALGIRTVFNCLGPLTNPAFVKRQVLGVSDLELAEKMVEVLKGLGHERALVVHGEDGLDEITVTGITTLFELKDGEVTKRELTPEDFGLDESELSAVFGGSVEDNSFDFIEILKGNLVGAKQDLVLANAGAGFYLAGKVENLKEGVDLARESIQSGNAYKYFERYRQLTQAL